MKRGDDRDKVVRKVSRTTQKCLPPVALRSEGFDATGTVVAKGLLGCVTQIDTGGRIVFGVESFTLCHDVLLSCWTRHADDNRQSLETENKVDIFYQVL